MSEVTVYAPQQQIVTSAFSALAYLTDEQLDVQIGLLRRAQDVAARVKKSLMIQDVHYGVIPGTNKPSLLKPGAEVLLQAFQLVATFGVDFRDGDGKTSPDVRAIVTCEIHVGDKSGPVIAEGIGLANSWERKHRRRQAQPTCPNCGKTGTVGRSKQEYGGGWFCNRKNGGCGEAFKGGSDGAKIIDSTDYGVIDNPDPHDLANTLVKMGKKRALIDATLTATASSDLFTQDMDEHAQAAPSGPRVVTTEMRAQAVLTAVADMSEAHKVRAKKLAADLGAERFTVRSLLASTDALDAVEDWITNGAELPVAVAPDAVSQPDGIYAPTDEPTTTEPAEHVVTMRDAYPSAFEADGSRPVAAADFSDEPF